LSAAAFATSIEVSGRMVLMSIRSVPGPAVSRTPPAASTTASTCGWSGSIVSTTSAPATASATPFAARPPAASSFSAAAVFTS
jgi:hypothetical protein